MSISSRRAEVLGDGPAALAAALGLARRGWRVDLVVPPRRAKEISRIDVLGGSALATLARLGVSRDDMLAVARPCPGTWSHWGREGPSGMDYLATPQGPAWAVDRCGFDALLEARALAAGVTRAAGREGRSWRILASGRLGATGAVDDELVALVAMGEVPASAAPVDTRLMIEAAPEAWAYGVMGPGRSVCLGVITDAEALAGARPGPFAADVLGRTERIVRLLDRLGGPLAVGATPLPCRFLPLHSDARSIRVGDAQASLDPLAGRGLWQAIRGAGEAAAALDEEPERLTLLAQRAQAAYRSYLATRAAFYCAGHDRFGTGFWARRLAAHSQRPRRRHAIADPEERRRFVI